MEAQYVDEESKSMKAVSITARDRAYLKIRGLSASRVLRRAIEDHRRGYVTPEDYLKLTDMFHWAFKLLKKHSLEKEFFGGLYKSDRDAFEKMQMDQVRR